MLNFISFHFFHVSLIFNFKSNFVWMVTRDRMKLLAENESYM